MSNNVNHPNHYQSESGLEVIDVIKAFTSELSGEEAFCIGNAIKYICRYSKKNGVEDLEKAKWYINRAISVRNTEFLKTPEPTADVKNAKWYIDRAISARSEQLKSAQSTIKKELNAALTKFIANSVYGTNSVYGPKNVQKMECDYNIGRFVFSSRDDADAVLKKLQSIVHERGYATLADLHDMCEFAFPSPFAKKVGWKSVDDFHIIPRERGDWELAPNERPVSIED